MFWYSCLGCWVSFAHASLCLNGKFLLTIYLLLLEINNYDRYTFIMLKKILKMHAVRVNTCTIYVTVYPFKMSSTILMGL